MSESTDLIRVNLGTVTSYGIALQNGFTGTNAEWVQKIMGGATAAEIERLRNAFEDLASDVHYNELLINSFSVSPASAEFGSTVQQISLAFSLSKTPVALTLDEEAQTPAQSGTITLTGQSITGNKTFTLAAEDNGSASHQAAYVTKTATLSFMNRVYYGAAAEPGTINSAFLLGLANAVLTTAKARTITINAGSGTYIWYAVPSRLGACAFTVGGFSGGFSKAATISHTNASGYTEDYDVYRSDNAALGSTTVSVQ